MGVPVRAAARVTYGTVPQRSAQLTLWNFLIDTKVDPCASLFGNEGVQNGTQRRTDVAGDVGYGNDRCGMFGWRINGAMG